MKSYDHAPVLRSWKLCADIADEDKRSKRRKKSKRQETSRTNESNASISKDEHARVHQGSDAAQAFKQLIQTRTKIIRVTLSHAILCASSRLLNLKAIIALLFVALQVARKN